MNYRQTYGQTDIARHDIIKVVFFSQRTKYYGRPKKKLIRKIK